MRFTVIVCIMYGLEVEANQSLIYDFELYVAFTRSPLEKRMMCEDGSI
jgi:hypothetical protein